MLNESLKLVRYEKYCKLCKNILVDDSEEPCNECMDNPYADTGPIPMHFEKRE